MLDDDGQWPVWTAPPAPQAHRDGYGGIARHVVPQVLEQRIRHAFPLGVRELCRQQVPAGPALDHLVVQRLWDSLVARRLAYTAPPWHPAHGQRIRDPEWLWRSGGSGTCLDLALLLAAACLNEDLDTFLVMLRGRNEAHAAVAVRLGSTPGVGDLPLGVATTDAHGVGVVVDPGEFVGEPDILLLDPTTGTAASPDTSLKHTFDVLAGLIGCGRYERVHLVDVTVRQRLGDRPLPAPSRRGTLRSRLAAPQLSRTRSFPSRDRAWASLAQRRGGIVVIHGPEGTGKSTLARQFALEADHGFGWFLSGGTRGAYRASLARAELTERAQELAALDADIEAELARSALDRLADEAGDWVVVLDNANDGPGPLGALPVPGPGQLLIVTTTGAPDAWPGAAPVELPELDEADLVRTDVDQRLRRVTAGSPLLLSAFTALDAAVPDALGELPPEPITDVDAGARLYWSRLRSALPREAPLAQRLALLPPDAIERTVADGLAPGTVSRLERLGLVTALSDDSYSLHRVLGRAIRAATTSEGTAAGAAGDVLADEGAFLSLVRFADPQVTQVLAEALEGCEDGLALARLGSLQELHDGVKASLATYHRAETLLSAVPPTPGTVPAAALADCYHARAREVNHRPPNLLTDDDLVSARAAVTAAVMLRGPEPSVEREKHLALGTLLRQRAADRLPDGSPEQIAEYRAVANELDGSWTRRREVLGDEHPLVDRALFNRAGVRLRLARLEPDHAPGHLSVAEQVYRRTLDFRRRRYAERSPLTSASLWGVAAWGYYAVLLEVTDETRSTIEEAVHHAAESLAMRMALAIPGDVTKSASILAKLSLLQIRNSGGDASALGHEALNELRLPCPEPPVPEQPAQIPTGEMAPVVIPLQHHADLAPPRAAAGH
ncbi:AAA family ATPase [Geodermatophilus sp. SYSU D01180]